MKHLSKTLFTVLLSLIFFACSEDIPNNQVNLVDNSKNINKIIGSLDLVFKKSIENPKLSDEELGKLFIEESERSGLTVVEIKPNDPTAKSSTENSTFSDEYLDFSSQIQNTRNYPTKEEFKNSLFELHNDVLNANISIEEKQILADNISFMTAFVDWMNTLETQTANKYSSSKKSNSESDCDGWWSCWGQCVAGTIGGALTTALEGCGIGAAVGGAASAVPSLGLATPVGIVGGCAIGGALGAIGGGLSGAAESC